jgi:hypothetical protein
MLSQPGIFLMLIPEYHHLAWSSLTISNFRSVHRSSKLYHYFLHFGRYPLEPLWVKWSLKSEKTPTLVKIETGSKSGTPLELSQDLTLMTYQRHHLGRHQLPVLCLQVIVRYLPSWHCHLHLIARKFQKTWVVIVMSNQFKAHCDKTHLVVLDQFNSFLTKFWVSAILSWVFNDLESLHSKLEPEDDIALLPIRGNGHEAWRDVAHCPDWQAHHFGNFERWEVLAQNTILNNTLEIVIFRLVRRARKDKC